MKTLKCIIADDEPIARQILENYIADIPYLSLVASCANAFEVMEALQQDTIDILFLDINMPKLSGLSLLKTIQQKPNVIITTAYPEYAVEGFELQAVDYLLTGKLTALQAPDIATIDQENIGKQKVELSLSPSYFKPIYRVNRQ